MSVPCSSHIDIAAISIHPVCVDNVPAGKLSGTPRIYSGRSE